MARYGYVSEVRVAVLVRTQATRYGNPDPADPTKVGSWTTRWNASVEFQGTPIFLPDLMQRDYPTEHAAVVAGKAAARGWAAGTRARARNFDPRD